MSYEEEDTWCSLPGASPKKRTSQLHSKKKEKKKEKEKEEKDLTIAQCLLHDRMRERVCCLLVRGGVVRGRECVFLLVLDSVNSTPQ